MTAFLKSVRKPELIQDRFRTIPWMQWKQRWAEAPDVETCASLLHYGMRIDVSGPTESVERLRCYLLLAEGHYGSRGTVHPAIAAKAFKVLFDGEPFRPLFDRHLLTLPPTGLAALLRFFRPKGIYENDGLANIWVPDAVQKNRHHVMAELNKGLLRWLFEMWHDEFIPDPQSIALGPWRLNKNTIQLARGLRPRIIKILHAYGHGQLEALLNKRGVMTAGNNLVYRTRWEQFTPDCLKTLEGLALRRGRTIRDAVVNDSTAAKVLLNVRAAQQLLAA